MSDGQGNDQSNGMPEETKGNFVVEYFKSFRVLKETRGEYWGMQVINFIDHTILFAVYTIAVLFFSAGTDEYGFGMSDEVAGYVYTVFGSLATICLFFSGLVSDWLGIRKSMFVNQGFLLFIRLAIVLVTLNQLLFSGDLQMRVNEGEQLCLIDRSGAEGAVSLSGAGGRGGQIIAQLGLAELGPIDAPEQENGAEAVEGAWYGGTALAKPMSVPAKNLREVISRINDAEGNELKGKKRKVEAKLGKDKQSLRLIDHTAGAGTLTVTNGGDSTAADDLGMAGAVAAEGEMQGEALFPQGSPTKLADLHDGRGVKASDFGADLVITAADESVIEVTLGKKYYDISRSTPLAKLNSGKGIHIVDPDPAERIGDVVARMQAAEGNDGKVTVEVEKIGENEHRLVLTDKAEGEARLRVENAAGSTAASDLGLAGEATEDQLVGSLAFGKGERMKLRKLGAGAGVRCADDGVDLLITASDGTVIEVELGEMSADVIRLTGADGSVDEIELTGVKTVGELISRIDAATGGWAAWLMAILFIAQAPFLAIGQTAFQAANKRFTTSRSRSAGFNLWYLFMNVGALFAGILVDVVFNVLDLPRVHVLTTGVFTAVICLVFIGLFVRREEQLVSPDEEVREVKPAGEDVEEGEGGIEEEKPWQVEEEERKSVGEGGKPKRLNPWQNAVAVASEPVFWRFTCLITLLLGVRAVFLYMHLVMPKFWTRVIGPDAWIGLLTSINPFLVIIGLILLIPILNKFSVYKMLVYGAIISGLSLFILAIPATGNRCYMISIICLVVLTVGEVIWSPRLTEYTAAIAPEGQEGTYLGLSMVPYFLAKTVVSALSGHMLDRWCPKPPEDNDFELRETLEAGEIGFWDSPYAMWFVLAVPAVGGPVIALMLRRWFTKGAHFKHGDQTE